MDGVENNVWSRFIDYSVVSPFEKLIADIETNGQHHNHKKSSINYCGINFVLATYDTSNKFCISHELFHNIFGISGKFLLLSRERGNVDVPSQRRLLFSSLITAIESSSLSIPAFFASSPIVFESKEILGYFVNREDLGSRKIFHFESVLQYGVSSQHRFHYLDALVEIFERKLRYIFPQIPSSTLLTGKMITEICDKYELLLATSDRAADMPSSLVIPGASDTPAPLAYLRPACIALPGNEDVAAADPALLRLTAELRYSGLTAANIVDNETRSSLFASLQPPEAWTLRALFHAEKKSSFPLSSTLGGLLGVFLAGYLSSPQTTVASLAATSCAVGSSLVEAAEIDNKALQRLCNAHSLHSRATILLQSLTSPSTDQIVRQVEAIIPSVLSSSGAVSIAERFALVSSDSIEEGTFKPQFMSRVALACGGVADLSAVAVLWVSLMKEVRSRWESGEPLPLPDVNENSGSQDEETELFSLPLQSMWPSLKKWLLREGGGGLYLPSINLPDSNCCIPEQKFQMIQLCLFLRAAGEDLVLECPRRWLHGPLHTLLPAAPASETNEDNLTETQIEDDSAALIKPPRLQFRLARTSDDTSALEHVLLASLADASGEGHGDIDHTVLHIHLRYPALASDIKAFKAINPDKSLVQFIAWYCGGRADLLPAVDSSWDSADNPDLSVWRAVWESCEAEHAYQQKPLFGIEREAEKALAHLELISLRSLSTSLLLTGLDASCALLEEQLLGLNSVLSSESITNPGVGRTSHSPLSADRPSLTLALEALRLKRTNVLGCINDLLGCDSSGYPTDDLLKLFIDSWIKLGRVVEDLELLLSRYRRCLAVLSGRALALGLGLGDDQQTAARLAMALALSAGEGEECERGVEAVCVAATDAEATLLLALAASSTNAAGTSRAQECSRELSPGFERSVWMSVLTSSVSSTEEWQRMHSCHRSEDNSLRVSFSTIVRD